MAVYVSLGKGTGLRQVVLLAGDGGDVRAGCEELHDVEVVEVHEEPIEQQGEEIRPQQAVDIDDGEPKTCRRTWTW